MRSVDVVASSSTALAGMLDRPGAWLRRKDVERVETITSGRLHEMLAETAGPGPSADELAFHLARIGGQRELFAALLIRATALGYPQSEQGLQIYNGQLQQLMSSAAPGEQEKLRVGSRDLWRTTLGHTFGMPRPNDPEANPGNKVMGVKEELGVVEARDVM